VKPTTDIKRTATHLFTEYILENKQNAPIKIQQNRLQNTLHIVKRENTNEMQQFRCLLSTTVSTCFGHHYAHHQENKDRVLLHMVFCAGSVACGWLQLWGVAL